MKLLSVGAIAVMLLAGCGAAPVMTAGSAERATSVTAAAKADWTVQSVTGDTQNGRAVVKGQSPEGAFELVMVSHRRQDRYWPDLVSVRLNGASILDRSRLRTLGDELYQAEQRLENHTTAFELNTLVITLHFAADGNIAFPARVN